MLIYIEKLGFFRLGENELIALGFCAVLLLYFMFAINDAFNIVMRKWLKK